MLIREWPGDTRPLWQRALEARQYDLEEATLPRQRVVSLFKKTGIRRAPLILKPRLEKRLIVKPVGPNLVECACGRRAVYVAYGKKLCATCFRIARAGFSVVVNKMPVVGG